MFQAEADEAERESPSLARREGRAGTFPQERWERRIKYVRQKPLLAETAFVIQAP